MRSDIIILTKTFISKENLLDTFKKVAERINLEIEKVNGNENKLAFWEKDKEQEDMRSFNLIFNDQNNFIKEKNRYISDYSMRFFLSHYHEDDLIGEFIRELFKSYPDLLVCNDEIPKEGFYIFEKAHFDTYSENNYHGLLYSEPKDLRNK